jgi:membrane protease YdiL (CAAX protease family)
MQETWLTVKLRDWYTHNPLWASTIIFVVLTLTVGNIYVNVIYDFLYNQGLQGLDNAIASFFTRFIVSSLALILLYILLYQQPRSIREYRQKLRVVKGYSLRITVGCGLVSFIIFAIVSASTLIALRAFTDDPLVFLKPPSDTHAGWLWPLFAINPGLFEETGFRGLLFTNLRRTYSEKTVIKLTAVLFGLFHFTGLTNGQSIIGTILIAMTATTLGYSWGYTTARTGSVIPSMIIHYLVNAFSEVLQQAYTTSDLLMLLHILSLAILYPIFSILATRLITSQHTPAHIAHAKHATALGR